MGGYTNFPNGLTSQGVPTLGMGGVTQGNVFFVCPGTGSDGNPGTNIKKPLATLDQALLLVTPNQNDIVYLLSTTDAATPDTYRVPAGGGLDWNVDGVSLIGVCAGQGVSNRARISNLSTDVTTNTLFTLSAKNCLLANLGIFHGVASWVGDSGVPTAMKLTGQHNKLINCAIQGLGDGAATNSMDVNLGSSLWLTGSENTFEDCYIGLETVPLGNTTAGAIYMSGGISRNKFKRCTVSTRGTHANHRQVRVAASSLQDIGAIFDNCDFTNSGIFVSPGAAADGCMVVGATANGGILIKDCGAVGFTFWEDATVSGKIYVSNPAVGAGKAGLGTVAVGT